MAPNRFMLKPRLNFLIFLLILNGTLFSQISPQINPYSSHQIAGPLILCRSINSQNQIPGIESASDNDNLFVSLRNGNVKSINPISDTTNWEAELGGAIISPIYVSADSLVVISKILYENEVKDDENKENQSEFAAVRLLDKNSGVVKWHTLLKLTADSDAILYGLGNTLIVANQKGDFYLLDKKFGKIILQKKVRQTLSTAPFFDKDRIFIGTSASEIIEVSITNLEIDRIIKVSDIPALIFFSENCLVWSDRNGKIHCLKSESRKTTKTSGKQYKQKWSLRIGGKISYVTALEKNILISSLDNYIYYVSAESGEIIWKQRMPGRPAFRPLLIGNFLVITTVGDSTALLIDAQSGKIVNKINTGSENFFTGSPGKISSLLFFPTSSGIFLYAPETLC